MDGLTVRRLKLDDKDVFTSLINDYVEEYIRTEDVYPVKYDPKIGKIYLGEITKEKSNFIILVALVKDQIIGFCIAEVHKFGKIEKAYFEGDRRGEVWDVYVNPKFRSMGVGKVLLKETEKVLLEQGCQNMVLNSVGVNNNGARELYERLGYKPWSIKYYKKINK